MNKHTRSVSLIDGHTEEMTDAEVIKALEICNSLHLRCGNGCPYYEVPYKDGKRCSEMMIDDTLDLIKRIQAKNKEFDEKLIIQKGLIDTQKAEIERYEQLISNKYCVCTRVGNGLIYSESSEDYDKIIGEISSEAIKEFWKRFDKVLCENIGPSKRVYWKISSDGNKLVKEMTEVSE